MNPKAVIAILVIIVIALVILACWQARCRAHDWREDWCCLECYAAHDQKEPCLDCAARKAAMRWWG